MASRKISNVNRAVFSNLRILKGKQIGAPQTQQKLLKGQNKDPNSATQ